MHNVMNKDIIIMVLTGKVVQENEDLWFVVRDRAAVKRLFYSSDSSSFGWQLSSGNWSTSFLSFLSFVVAVMVVIVRTVSTYNVDDTQINKNVNE